MHIKTVLNKCHKFKSFVYEQVEFVDKSETLIEVKVVARANAKAVCSDCGESASLYDRLGVRRFEFIPLWGYRVFFVYIMRRVNCPSCGVTVERVPWGSGKRELTTTYMQFLAHWGRKLSWQEVAETFRTSWPKVFCAVEYMVEWGLKERELSGITAIGIDEVSWSKGHKYLTLVYQIDSHCTRLLWIGRERTVETLSSFFHFLGESRSQSLRYICSDMWKPYLRVIAEKAGQAIHILDRFHIVAMVNKAIDEVRAGEQRQMQKDGHDPLLTKSRWCLLKRKENLTERQETKLKDLLRYNLRSVRAYLLKEDFNGFWEYVSAKWAGVFLDRWCTRVMRSRIAPLKKVAGTIRRHRGLILNWFKAKKSFSSGIVEGLNNKVKVTTRKSYGFRTYKCAEIALYHVLGKLPEPKITHRFY